MNQISTLNNYEIYSPSLLLKSDSQLHQEALSLWTDRINLQNAIVYPFAFEYEQSNDDIIAQAVDEAIATERKRLARDLHDAVSQTLFAASLIAEVLPDLWDMDEGKARKSTEELRQLTRGALAEMRTLLFELRPSALNQVSLPDLLKQISEAIIGRERLPIHLRMTGECEIPCEVKVEIYRIAQESLNNIVKYAHAKSVEITLHLEANSAHLEIKDDGIGFDPACVKPTNLGLRIMYERAEAIQAHLAITSQPGQGTSICLDWPK